MNALTYSAGALLAAVIGMPAWSGGALTQAGPSPLQYESTFASYRPYQDPELVPWAAANEAVSKGAAHAHGKEPAKAEPASAPMPSGTQAPQADGHDHGETK